MLPIKSIIIKNFILPIADHFMKTDISRSYKEIIRLKKLSKEEISKWQIDKLKLLLWHAFDHTKYYKQIFISANLTPNDINSISDLQKLPILTKEIIRNNYQDLIPDNINDIQHIKSSTGGSTGTPLMFLLDRKSWSFSNATNTINWEQAGYKYGDKFIALGSTSLFVNKKASLKHLLYYKLKSKIGLSGINMSDEVCEEYLSIINNNKVHFLYGYASSIYLLAKYVLKTSGKINIKACFTTSEVLTDLYRDTIIKAFNCKVLNSYGAHDGGINAYEQQDGFFEVSYNSIINMTNLNSETSIIPACLTDVLNYAMPLINYQLGDEYLINQDLNINYAYNGQVINKVLGRTSDIIQLENGITLTGPGFTILFKDIPVEYYCIEKNGINSINCSIKVLPGYNSEHETLILSTLKKQMGLDSNISILYSDDVKLAPNGKRLYFVTS
jgi:phenylacetate-CoA ligase